MSLKAQLIEDMKTAMKAGEKDRLGVIRLINAGLKQREVDERIEITDAVVLSVLEKMVKQRRDSISQYEAAQRQDLADAEKYEVGVLSTYLPQPLSDAEVVALLDAAIAETGAAGVKDMGKVMALVKPQIIGRADVGKVSGQIKARLGG